MPPSAPLVLVLLTESISVRHRTIQPKGLEDFGPLRAYDTRLPDLMQH